MAGNRIYLTERFGPLGLLSGLPYRNKLLSLVFLYNLKCNSSIAKIFTLVTFHLNNF